MEIEVARAAQETWAPSPLVRRPLIFARSEKLRRGRVAFDYTQKSTAFMGKEAEPSVSRFVCAARVALPRAGENGRGGGWRGRREKESESKNPNKLPKDSAENARTTDRSLTCSDHCCRSNCHAGERNLIPRGGIY